MEFFDLNIDTDLLGANPGYTGVRCFTTTTTTYQNPGGRCGTLENNVKIKDRPGTTIFNPGNPLLKEGPVLRK